MTDALVLTAQDRSRRVGWWGMIILITTEAMIFAALLSSYFFVRANSATWPQDDIKPPELAKVAVFTAVLLASSLPLFWGEAAIRRGKVSQLRVALALSWLLGAVFVVNQVFEFHALEFNVGDNAYASLFIVITGLHGLHLLVGLAISGVVQIKAAVGWFGPSRHQTVTVFALYWHFVDVVWIFVFSSLYLSAHIR
jgi:heme/copper-type cytochrome/quinol oxidase subunit 3